jgi:hypothetical protein
MLHYIAHAGSVPWQEQLRWILGILLVIAALFLFFWWRRRAHRPAQGDFAALAQAPQIQTALAAQQATAGQDAAAAWQQTQDTLQTVRRTTERGLALVFCLLAGLGCVITGLMGAMSLTDGWRGLGWGALLLWALCVLCGWFARVQWREFRGLA